VGGRGVGRNPVIVTLMSCLGMGRQKLGMGGVPYGLAEWLAFAACR
jgi:hypothetical protein